MNTPRTNFAFNVNEVTDFCCIFAQFLTITSIKGLSYRTGMKNSKARTTNIIQMRMINFIPLPVIERRGERYCVLHQRGLPPQWPHVKGRVAGAGAHQAG